MQTKHLLVLIHIWTKGEVGAPLNRFKPSSKIFLLTVQRRCFFCGSFMLFLPRFVMLSCTSVCGCLVGTCWERTDILALVCVGLLWRHFPIGILGQVWCLIVSIPDLCPLYYFFFPRIKSQISLSGAQKYTRPNKTSHIKIKIFRVKWELQNFICYLCFATISATSVGAKYQILSSVAPPRKKDMVTIFSQGHVLGPWKPMFY